MFLRRMSLLVLLLFCIILISNTWWPIVAYVTACICMPLCAWTPYCTLQVPINTAYTVNSTLQSAVFPAQCCAVRVRATEHFAIRLHAAVTVADGKMERTCSGELPSAWHGRRPLRKTLVNHKTPTVWSFRSLRPLTMTCSSKTKTAQDKRWLAFWLISSQRIARQTVCAQISLRFYDADQPTSTAAASVLISKKTALNPMWGPPPRQTDTLTVPLGGGRHRDGQTDLRFGCVFKGLCIELSVRPSPSNSGWTVCQSTVKFGVGVLYQN